MKHQIVQGASSLSRLHLALVDMERLSQPLVTQQCCTTLETYLRSQLTLLLETMCFPGDGTVSRHLRSGIRAPASGWSTEINSSDSSIKLAIMVQANLSEMYMKMYLRRINKSYTCISIDYFTRLKIKK